MECRHPLLNLRQKGIHAIHKQCCEAVEPSFQIAYPFPKPYRRFGIEKHPPLKIGVGLVPDRQKTKVFEKIKSIFKPRFR
jgi:hypothetical protein